MVETTLPLRNSGMMARIRESNFDLRWQDLLFVYLSVDFYLFGMCPLGSDVSLWELSHVVGFVVGYNHIYVLFTVF